MNDGDDLKDHLGKFFDVVDKLEEMEKKDKDLLSVMLLYRPRNMRILDTPSSQEIRFLNVLRIKIAEEYKARLNETRSTGQAIYSKRYLEKRNFKSPKEGSSKSSKSNGEASNTFKFNCHKCHKIDRKAINCGEKMKDTAKIAEDLSLYVEALQTSKERSSNWCLDSGATS